MIYPTGWTCAFESAVTNSRVAIVDRPCVVKSLTFVMDNSLAAGNDLQTVVIYDGTTELFDVCTGGLTNYQAIPFNVLFPISGLRIDNSFEIQVDGDSVYRRITGVSVLFQAGPSDRA